MKTLSLSGGGTKIAALAGAAITTIDLFGYKPDIIVGTSAGGILTLPLAMGLTEELKDLIINLTLDDIFSFKPVNKKGNIRFLAIVRLLLGYPSLGKQDNLIKSMQKIITKERFAEYLENKDYPDVLITAVEFKTGSRKYFKVRDLDYNTYLKVVSATSSIPVFVEPVEINNGYYYDGGIRDFIGSHKVFEMYDVKENISIYSRAIDYDSSNPNWKPKNVIIVLTRTTDIMLTEISKNDELLEDKIAKEKGIKNTKVFMKHITSNGAYQMDKKQLTQWYEMGVQSAMKYIK